MTEANGETNGFHPHVADLEPPIEHQHQAGFVPPLIQFSSMHHQLNHHIPNPDTNDNMNTSTITAGQCPTNSFMIFTSSQSHLNPIDQNSNRATPAPDLIAINSDTNLDESLTGGSEYDDSATTADDSRDSLSYRSSSAPNFQYLMTSNGVVLTESNKKTSSSNRRKSSGGRAGGSRGSSASDERCQDPEEERKRRLRRERNKQAAARCRKRRMDHTNQLLRETEVLEERRQALRNEVQLLKQERDDLEMVLEQHKMHCKKFLNSSSMNNTSMEDIDIKPVIVNLVQMPMSQANVTAV